MSTVTVPYDDVMAGDSGLAKWLENIDTYGIGFVSGVPPTPEATEALGRRISFIRETHYGTFWDFTANNAHGDTAYTSIALPAHTDTTYFTDPIGLQLFQLLEHKGQGGKSLYVDGFHVAQELKSKNPHAYEILSKYRIPTHSAGDPDTIITSSPRSFPILNHDPVSGELYQIRFNNDDRSVLRGSSFVSNIVSGFGETSSTIQQQQQKEQPTRIHHPRILFSVKRLDAVSQVT
ncbi:hypothetical protein HDU76_007046 [Blyttiomyces sp. JEL0837]|nr:hypothetical protein HDU76_007046 [Blyttiomyces sp. JEL0837]